MSGEGLSRRVRPQVPAGDFVATVVGTRPTRGREPTQGVCRVESSVRERVAEMVPRIREEAGRTEAERRIPTEVLAALLDAGVFALAPADRAAQARLLLDVVQQVAAACGSTGWVTAHSGAIPWVLDLFPPEARQHVRGERDVDPLIAFSAEAGGTVTEDPDGLRLDGRWSAVTGAAQASWLVVAARRRTDGEPGRVGLALVEASACRLEESVDSVGLTASGAQEVSASSIPLAAFAWAETGQRTGDLVPVGAAVAMALVGAARGALDTHLEQTRARVALSHGGEDVTARDLSPARVARAASSLDAAALVLRGPADPDALPRDPFDDQLFAVERAAEAAGLVFSSVRGHALDNDDPVARLWRDVRVGAQHARALISRLRVLGA